MRNRISQSEIQYLSRVPLFSRCTKAELRHIATYGTPLTVPSGKVLTKEGASGREFFLVLKGKASCTIRNRQVNVISEGDFFGELALLEGGIRTATITATSEMQLLVLDAGEFKDLVASSPTISSNLMAALATRIRENEG
jgi:CRP/FNR family cyclic AMP-dependent transcriptional regulator